MNAQQITDTVLLLQTGNRAQQLVALSCALDNPEQSDWAVVAVGMGATRQRPGLYRFPDGSAVTMAGADGLPIEYVGG